MMAYKYQPMLHTKIKLFPGARPQNNKIIKLLNVVGCQNSMFSTRTASRYNFKKLMLNPSGTTKKTFKA